MSINNIGSVAEKLRKLADKTTPAPWTAQVRETDCIIFPESEKDDEEQTVIFENQFPDAACKHNTRFVLACRNHIGKFASDILKLLDSLKWKSADLKENTDLPKLEDPVEVLVGGYPTTGLLMEHSQGVYSYREWISYFTDAPIIPTHWRPLSPVGRNIGEYNPKKQPQHKVERLSSDIER